MAAMQWYCLIEGVESGPFTGAQLKKMSDEEKLNQWDFVRAGKQGNWRPVTDFEQLCKKPCKKTTAKFNLGNGFDKFYRHYFWIQFVVSAIVAIISVVCYLYVDSIHDAKRATDSAVANSGQEIRKMTFDFATTAGAFLTGLMGSLLALIFIPLVVAPRAWFENFDKGQYWLQTSGGISMPAFRVVIGILGAIGIFILLIMIWNFVDYK